MRKKSNNEVFIVAGILAVLVLLLLVLIAALLFGEKGQKQGKNGNAGPFVVNDSAEDTSSESASDVFEKEIGQEKEEAGNGMTIVIDGFRFQIPSDYGCLYGDGIGPVVYLDDVFQMKLAVSDTSYEESMKNPDSLTEKTIAAGGEILQEVRETELEGKEYAYFYMKLDGEQNFVVYTKALDTEKRFCGQIVIQKEDLSDEDLLHIFESVISSAQETNEPDSTADDITGQAAAVTGKKDEEKEESTMRLNEETATFLVPKDFYSNEQYVKEEFVSKDSAIYVNCYLRPTEKGTIFENAKACIEADKEFRIGSVKNETEIQTINSNGTLFYYIAVHYEYDGSDYQYVYAACDIGENAIYKVEAQAIDKDVELSIDTIRDFLVLK